MNYRDKSVLVTGASSGIGRQLALDFAARGARVAIVARRADRLEEVAKECHAAGGRAEIFAGDLGDRAFQAGLVDRAAKALGGLDILVNNAGIPKHKQIYDATHDDLVRTLEINFLAPARLALDALPHLLARGEGFIVNISSAAGRVPPPREAIYAASKFALTGFSEGLSLDLEGSGIHTAVVHVGAIDTEIWERAACEAPVAFQGKKHPPSLISKAVFRCIEERRAEITAPGVLRLAFLFKELLPGLFRKGSARFDPVPADVIAAARERARSVVAAAGR
jgi:short-subunit dehydrogenase